MATIASLNVILSASTAQFTAGLKSALGKLSSFTKGASRQLKGLGRLPTLIGGTAVAGFLKASSDAFIESEKATAKLGAVLKSTRGAAELTKGQIGDLADELAQVTVFEDDVTKNAAAMLATFTSIKGDVFKDAIKSSQDLATVMDTDLTSAVTQVGKALNDPIKGITALTRSGVTFNDTQKETIKKFVQMGQVAKAQKLILEELQKEFGGAAEAIGKTAGGQLEIAKNRFGELMELVGKNSAPLLASSSDKALGVLERLSGETLNRTQSAVNAGGLTAGDNPLEMNAADLKKQIQDAMNRRDTIMRELDANRNWLFGDDFSIDPGSAKGKFKDQFNVATKEIDLLQDRLERLQKLGLDTPQAAAGRKNGFSELLEDGIKSLGPAVEGLGKSMQKNLGLAWDKVDDLSSGFQNLEAKTRDFMKAFEIKQAGLSPLSQFKKERDELLRLFDKGLFTEEEFDRALGQARKPLEDFVGLSDPLPSRTAGARRGSAEAFAHIAAFQDRANDPLQRSMDQLVALAEQQLALERARDRKTKDQADVIDTVDSKP